MFHVRGEEHFDSTSTDTFGFSPWRRFLNLTEAQPNTLEQEIKTFIWTNYVPNGPKEKRHFRWIMLGKAAKRTNFLREGVVGKGVQVFAAVGWKEKGVRVREQWMIGKLQTFFYKKSLNSRFQTCFKHAQFPDCFRKKRTTVTTAGSTIWHVSGNFTSNTKWSTGIVSILLFVQLKALRKVRCCGHTPSAQIPNHSVHQPYEPLINPNAFRCLHHMWFGKSRSLLTNAVAMIRRFSADKTAWLDHTTVLLSTSSHSRGGL